MNRFWLPDQPLVLASGSEARRKLLEAAAFDFEIRVAPFDEEAVKKRNTHLDACGLSELLAFEKAKAVSGMLEGRYVLGSDQTLEHDGKILGKPGTLENVAAQLRALSGRVHLLWSAASLVRDGQEIFSCVSKAEIAVRKLSGEAIARYIKAADPAIVRSVGGYHLEAEGLHLFERVEGDYWTILGLPMLQICREMRKRGLLTE